MAGSFTEQLRLLKQAIGGNPMTWGDSFNLSAITLLDQAITDYTLVNLTSSDVTLTVADGIASTARVGIITCTGGTASRNVIVPTVGKLYVIYNSRSGVSTIKTAVDAGVAVPANSLVYLLVDPSIPSVREIGGNSGYTEVSAELGPVLVPMPNSGGQEAYVSYWKEGPIGSIVIYGHVFGTWTTSDFTYSVFDVVPPEYQPELQVGVSATVFDGVTPRSCTFEVDARGVGTSVRVYRTDGGSWSLANRQLPQNVRISYPLISDP